MTISVQHDSTWELARMFVWADGQYKRVLVGFVYTDGQWREFYTDGMFWGSMVWNEMTW